MKSSRRFPWAAFFVLVLAGSGASPAAGGETPRYLTGPQTGSARELALAYLGQQGQRLGVTDRNLPSLVVIREYTSQHNGVTHVYLRQHLDGLEVAGADVSVNVARDGSIINVGGAVVSNLDQPVAGRNPTLDATQALQAAARHLGLNSAALPSEPVPSKLVYQPVAKGGVRLAWQLEIEEPSGEHWWNVKVDAATAEVLDIFDYVVQEDFGLPSGATPGP